MNFFEHQDQARRNTSRLIALFIAAMAFLILGLYALALVFASAGELQEGRPPTLWAPELLATVTVALTVIVGIASGVKIRSLSSGGSSVALMLGGRLVDPGTSDPHERQLINVVEEMAIASGVPVPLVFVLDDERGINAFAAGYSPDDAAVAVTRGTLMLLDRDELQGVIAHEFSHILNGDMRLNIRLIGILAGILVIGQTGIFILRSAALSGSRRRRSSRDGQEIFVAIAFGAALAVIGYAGVFFGRLIKAAVSRQREFLADASAVQFTRNPTGLGGALKKIAGYDRHGRVLASNAEELSHLFFADAIKRSFFSGAFATHPPVDERIRRIDPGFRGEVGRYVPEQSLFDERSSTDESSLFSQAAPVAPMAPTPASSAHESRHRVEPSAVVDRVGAPGPAHLDYGRRALAAIPERVREAAHSPFGAIATVYALLLSREEEVRRKQHDVLRREDGAELLREAERLAPLIDTLSPMLRLPTVEIAVPALRNLSADQRDRFVRVLRQLAEADDTITVFEYTLHRFILRRTAADAGRTRRSRVQYTAFRPLYPDTNVLLSALAWIGDDTPGRAAAAYRAAAERLPGRAQDKLTLLAPEDCSYAAIDRALDRLRQASPMIRKQVLDAAAHCAFADREITIDEAELLREVAEVLDCPLPPFIELFDLDDADA